MLDAWQTTLLILIVFLMLYYFMVVIDNRLSSSAPIRTFLSEGFESEQGNGEEPYDSSMPPSTIKSFSTTTWFRRKRGFF